MTSPELFPPPKSEWPYPPDSTPGQRRMMRKVREQVGNAKIRRRLETMIRARRRWGRV